jgi:hypothetical protein
LQLALDSVSLAYLFGGVGILVEWRAYWLADGLAFRRWSAAGALLWAAQYLLLDARTAGLTMASTALRTMLSGRVEKGFYKHWAAAGFVALFTGLTVFSWQGQVSLLPAFAVINTTLALFYLNNRHMRIALLASSLAWIGNDYIWQAWPALLAESVAMGINLRTIRKLFVNRG